MSSAKNESTGTSLVDLQERIKSELANVRKSVAPPASNRISTAGKRFSLPDGRVSTDPLRVIVLDHRNVHRYYTKPYDANNPAPPDCFAIAKEFDDLSPKNHEGVLKPQADACATCPRNEWGSAANGKGKACRNMVRLALAATDTKDSTILTLEVPPTALKHWNNHVSNLAAIGKLPIQVVTQIGFDDGRAYPCPTFDAVAEHEELEHFWALREKAQAMLDQEPSAGG